MRDIEILMWMDLKVYYISIKIIIVLWFINDIFDNKMYFKNFGKG